MPFKPFLTNETLQPHNVLPWDESNIQSLLSDTCNIDMTDRHGNVRNERTISFPLNKIRRDSL